MEVTTYYLTTKKKALSSWDSAFFYDDYKLHENRMMEGKGV